MSKFNIASKAVATSGTCQLTEVDGSPMYGDGGLQCAIAGYSPGTMEYQRAATRRTNRALNRIRKGGKMDMTAEQKLEEEALFLADITTSFINFEYQVEGEPELHGHAMFKAAYSDPAIGHIAAQWANFVGDWENFPTGSAKS